MSGHTVGGVLHEIQGVVGRTRRTSPGRSGRPVVVPNDPLEEPGRQSPEVSDRGFVLLTDVVGGGEGGVPWGRIVTGVQVEK